MGSKGRFLIFFMILPLCAGAQEKLDFRVYDALTYRYYASENWDSLIAYGNKVIKSGTDYKFLRQRLGYAYFMKGDYNSAARQFSKALKFDSYNQFSIEYFYYSNINRGKELYSGSYLSRLDQNFKKSLSIRRFKPIESIEAEYDYKYSGTALRTNPAYLRVGISSALGYRVRLFQSFSSYSSSVRSTQAASFNSVLQSGYYLGLNYNSSGSIVLKGAYHHLVTKVSNKATIGNLYLLSANPDFFRWSFEITGSILNILNSNTFQGGATVTYSFPSKMDIYVKEGMSIVSDGNARIVFSSAAGLKLLKNVWIEGNLTSGDMNRYNDFNGLYVYNSYDPLTFRTGGTIIYYLGKKLSIWMNCSYEKKEYAESRSFKYNQISYLGGFKWKI